MLTAHRCRSPCHNRPKGSGPGLTPCSIAKIEFSGPVTRNGSSVEHLRLRCCLAAESGLYWTITLNRCRPPASGSGKAQIKTVNRDHCAGLSSPGGLASVSRHFAIVVLFGARQLGECGSNFGIARYGRGHFRAQRFKFALNRRP